MKKIFFTLILAILTSVSSSANAADKLLVLLDWFANPDHAPLFVAEKQGYFKQQGLDVELVGPADPADPPKLVAAGKADIAITYQPQFLEQIDQGLPLIRIGTLIDKPLNCLVVLKESPIQTVTALKGKRVGYSSGGMGDATLKVMLEKNGLTLKDVEVINIHYDLTQAMLTKKVDAVIGMMRNFEVTQLELAGKPARVFYPEQNGMPTYSELIFVVQRQKQHDPRFPRFLKAVEQGVGYLKKHPEEAWQDFANRHPESNNELNHRAWQATLPYFAKNPVKLDSAEFLRFAQFMRDNGLIKTVQPMTIYNNG